MNRFFGLLLCFVLVWLATPVLQAQPLGANVKRVVFLGNSITYAGNYVNQVTAYLMAQNPNRQIEFINVGLPSETVSGLSEEGHAGGSFPRPHLHERLARVLAQTKPDLVFACYGMNDGIYLPLNEARFNKFKNGMNWLHEQVTKTGARLIHLTPPDYDELKGKQKGYATVLDKYANWLLIQKKSANWEVIDIHYPMQEYLQAHRQVDATFGIDGFALAPDGVHPGETGHWIMAREILKYLGYKEAARQPGIVESLKQVPDAEQYYKLITERQNLLRDAWLMATKHQRPGLPGGLPLPEAEQKASELQEQIHLLVNKK
ncbi:SGNH/GDSL hydrolase family protein [Adhaeribacter swui]|uniref:SGNH/GDSL hydrolase family protein n=1 Tax=Adhaeribacter swui TaxID=2086471 RepID=A0A7G7GDY6_9BACT|nr:SGNH/GDSL hydrolase family protein [Adhaeribacter swui]QNF35370.1 SGNH/GDSL hydrolase family protein [Adhaeribacter swui]